jgi:ribosomal protein L9
MSLSSSAVFSLSKRIRVRSFPLTITTRRAMGHSVRIILKEDLPNGKAYKGDVLNVKAGYARNHLIPGKYAVYATEENFARLGMPDPDLETAAQTAARLAREAMSEEGAAELKAADLLKHYLRNKEVRTWNF